MIKLIASDLDGTLLHNGAQKLTPRAIELIHELTQKGVHFVAASGRQYDNERRLFSEIKDEISYIGENGSICIHQGTVISRGIIADDLAYRIIDEVKKSPNFDILISREDACLIEDNHEAFVNHIVNVMQNTTKIVDDLSKIEGPFLKIAICNMIDDTKVIMQYLEHLQEMFGAEIKVVTSGNLCVDFICQDANKGSALQDLASHLHIDPEDCVVFGDQYNDVEMLQTAGTSYAMKNGAPGIEKYATHVTDSVETVLAEIINGLAV